MMGVDRTNSRRRKRPGGDGYTHDIVNEMPDVHDAKNMPVDWSAPAAAGGGSSNSGAALRHRRGGAPQPTTTERISAGSFSSTALFSSQDLMNAGNTSTTSTCSNSSAPSMMMMEHQPDTNADNSADIRARGGGNGSGSIDLLDNRAGSSTCTMHQAIEEDQASISAYEDGPIYTDSGLQLTHRSPAGANGKLNTSRALNGGDGNIRSSYGGGRGARASMDTSMGMDMDDDRRQNRILNYVRLATTALFAAILLGTGVAVSAVRHERRMAADAAAAATTQQQTSGNANRRLQNNVKKVVKPPTLPTAEHPVAARSIKHHYAEEVVQELRLEFDAWVERHKRDYGSHEEKEKRFGIWLDNHHEITKLNERHGPCKLTGKKVFGDNHLKDLHPDEFKSKYLTGYTGPRAEHVPKESLVRTHEAIAKKNKKEKNRQRSLKPQSSSSSTASSAERHPSVQKRYLEFVPVADDANGGHKQEYHQSNFYSSIFTIGGCKWYDFSCILKYMFTGHILGGVREPAYDGDSYPDAIDWRDMGVVTSIHSQGNCGACWAITAVETIESAYAIRKGSLVDLSESEVITCDDTCQMCDGGWPQNAYDYVMRHNGLPAESDWSYDGDWLLTLTYVMNGESNEYDQGEVYEYLYSQCPDYGQGSGSQHSGDNNAWYSAGDGSSFTRYGQIQGYGYSTDKCLCYTDGTGCQCDEQNEKLAIRNVASYGPATVCVDANVWLYYEGGILTADSGCSAGFMDMNHCVQAVGYAFVDVTADGNGEDNENQDSHQSGSGSKDDAQRVGYWILRNQWGGNWGMNGYLYVAMGDNTCGVLNDMTQVYS